MGACSQGYRAGGGAVPGCEQYNLPLSFPVVTPGRVTTRLKDVWLSFSWSLCPEVPYEVLYTVKSCKVNLKLSSSLESEKEEAARDEKHRRSTREHERGGREVQEIRWENRRNLSPSAQAQGNWVLILDIDSPVTGHTLTSNLPTPQPPTELWLSSNTETLAAL